MSPKIFYSIYSVLNFGTFEDLSIRQVSFDTYIWIILRYINTQLFLIIFSILLKVNDMELSILKPL